MENTKAILDLSLQAILAIATVGLAIGTGILARFTFLMWRSTHTLASHTATVAAETNDLARQTAELAKDTVAATALADQHHQEALMPYLMITGGETFAPDTELILRARIRNVG